MRLRPATDQDAEAATALIIAVDVDTLGEPDYDIGALRDEWALLDLARDTAIVEDARGTPIGCAHFLGGRVLVAVDPTRQGEGAGGALLAWATARARERGASSIKQAVGSDRARALLEAHGWEHTRRFTRMERTLGADDTADERGLRAVDTGDAAVLHAIYAAAFATDSGYEPTSLEDWTQRELQAHDADLDGSRIAGADGFALARRWDDVTYVALLAVRPEAQRRGLGTRLLRATFAAAARAGQTRAVLNVASDNPRATALYERAGMRVVWRVDDYRKALPDYAG